MGWLAAVKWDDLVRRVVWLLLQAPIVGGVELLLHGVAGCKRVLG